ncbi:phage major capsid protein [Sphingomonas sp. ABOLG]|uniref:phage major capsid protein n=1 Tax=Sphingomonas sp. ABOLG TaxID=1985880 RepID=UPI0019D29FA2|nr:phage major capsid protein [Sphingomonas sp. ABOLG]
MRKTMLLAAASMVAAIGPMSANERRHGRYMRDGDGHSAPLTGLAALRAQRNTLVATMRGMINAAETENRDFTAEETAAYDEHQAVLASLTTRIDRLVGIETAEAAGAAVTQAVSRRQGITPPPGPHGRREFESLGEFMAAVRFNPNDQRLNFVEGVGSQGEDGTEIGAELRMDDHQTGGGFLVPTQFRQEIMRVQEQDALVRPRANVIPAGSPPDAALTIPALDQSGAGPNNIFGGVQVQWIEEGGDKPETDVNLRSITLEPKEVAGTIVVTDKMLRNWQAASSFLENLLRGAVTQAEDYAFLRGDGVGKPLGAINSPAMFLVNRRTAGQVTYLDLLDMVSHLLMRGGTAPVWSMPQGALVQIATLQDPEGRYIWKPDARDGFAGTLLGYPVRWNNRAPVLGTKGDITLVDWSQYLIKDGSGPFVAASEHVLFRQNKTVIKIFWNVDGKPWLTAPIREENGWQVSPFVGLTVPA